MPLVPGSFAYSISLGKPGRTKPYVEGWNHEPEQKEGLEKEVEWEPEEQDVCEGLDQRHETVDNPTQRDGQRVDSLAFLVHFLRGKDGLQSPDALPVGQPIQSWEDVKAMSSSRQCSDTINQA